MIGKLLVFGLGESRGFAERVANAITNKQDGVNLKNFPKFYFPELPSTPSPLAKHIEDRRPDGEIYTRSLENVRGADVYIVTSLYGDTTESVDEKMMKLLLFINTLRHASAGRITVVARYLSYMRQDRKTESRAPISTQAVAIMLESLGMDRLIMMDAHNIGAEQNAFRVPIDNLEARKILADAIVQDYQARSKLLGAIVTDCYVPWTVVAPDAGGVGRTKLMQRSLEKRLGEHVNIVYADKTRINANDVKINIVGNVKHHKVIVVDDMISTGGTLAEICDAIREQEGVVYAVCATHGLFVNGAPEKLMNIPLIYVTDTIEHELPPALSNVKRVSTVDLFAEAILRTHRDGGSISDLIED